MIPSIVSSLQLHRPHYRKPMVAAQSDNSHRPDGPTLPPQVAMLQMASAYRVSQAIHVAAKLGVADRLSAGAQSISVLAAATQTHPQSLYRLLRALASLEIFAETAAGEFELTPRAVTLQSHSPDSLRDYAITLGELWHWRTWGEILHSVKTGQPAFEHVHGLSLSDFFGQNPDVADTFERSMVSLLTTIDANLRANYDFSPFHTIVEIGIPGSYGHLLSQILQENPQQQGIFFDLAPGREAVRAVLGDAAIADRCQLLIADGFASLPTGGDLYLLKNFIHDWNDHDAGNILADFAAVMAPEAKLLLVEMIIPPGNAPALGKIVDIEALVMSPGGYERTEAQYRSLLATAGLCLTRLISTPAPFSLIESVRI